MRTAIKGFRQAAGENGGDVAVLEQQYRKVAVIIDKAASKGVIHRKNASRNISRLAQLLNRNSTAPTS
jgi:small subunit ribosomal protein S20